MDPKMKNINESEEKNPLPLPSINRNHDTSTTTTTNNNNDNVDTNKNESYNHDNDTVLHNDNVIKEISTTFEDTLSPINVRHIERENIKKSISLLTISNIDNRSNTTSEVDDSTAIGRNNEVTTLNDSQHPNESPLTTTTTTIKDEKATSKQDDESQQECADEQQDESHQAHAATLTIISARPREEDDENESEDDDDDDNISEQDSIPSQQPGAYRIPGILGSNPTLNDSHDYDDEINELDQPIQGGEGGGEEEEDFVKIDAIGDDELRSSLNIRELVKQRLIKGLNIATEVTTNNEDEQQENDNNNSKRFWRFLFLMFGLGLIIIAITLSTLFLLRSKNSIIDTTTINTTDIPTESPTTISDFDYGQQILFHLSGDTIFNRSSNQYQALEWLVYDDPLQLNLKEERNLSSIINRYVLAILYFATNGPNWFRNDTFLINTSICDWEGIECNVLGELTNIVLDKNNLNGTIPMELSAITSIENIDFFDNNLYGTIPSSFGKLVRLDFLQLAYNYLTGSIPKSFENLTKLEILNLYFNQLTGTIPEDMIYNAIDLEHLDLAVNFLSGTIPSKFERNTNKLYFIDLGDNRLVGSIPISIFTLNSLEILHLSNNLITGTIPSLQPGEEIGGSTALQYMTVLNLYGNELSGTIPTFLGSLEYLQYLYLYSNKLSGTVPTEIGKLLDLIYLYIGDNELVGTIPSELGSLHKLKNVWAGYNTFTGTLPSTLHRLSNLEFVHFSNTSIIGEFDSIFCENRETKPIGFISGDCGGSQPQVNCTCCTECCNDDSGICERNLYQNCRNHANPIENGAFFNDVNLQSVCNCTNDGMSFSCEQREDSNYTICESCNEDGTVCGIQTNFGWTFYLNGDKEEWKTSFKYTLGRNDTISFYSKFFSAERRVYVNGQECSHSNGVICSDEFHTFIVDCRNIIDDSSGYYDGCHPYSGGVFEVFDMYFTQTWTGCKPFWYL